MGVRRSRKIWLTCSVLVLGLALAAWQLHFRPKWALAAYRQQLMAAGEKFDLAQLVPAAVTLERNGADLFLKANAAMNVTWGVLESNPPPAMRMVAPGKGMVGWRQAELRGDKGTNSWEEAEAVLAGMDSGLVLLEGLQRCDTIDFAPDYRQGFLLPLPNLANLKRATQRLNSAVLSALHRGDTETAFVRLRTMLALVRTTGDERLIISQLVRFAIAAITVNATWEFLQSDAVTDDQLVTLQRDWAALDFLQPVEDALAMERAMSDMTATQMRESSVEFDKMLSMYSMGSGSGSGATPGDWFEQAQEYGKDAWQKTKTRSRELAWRTMWSYPDQLRAFRGQQVLIEAVRQARTNGNFGAALANQTERLDQLGFHIENTDADSGWMAGDDLDLQSLFSQGINSLERILIKGMSISVSRQLVVTAIALKRHQRRHGGVPKELSELVPEFLSAVPCDPVDGAPLRYKSQSNDSRLLYSIGENQKDEGGDVRPEKEGNPSLLWQRGRDWVWPRPATDAEVGEYFSKPPNKR